MRCAAAHPDRRALIACTAALALAVSPTAVVADSLGRLFSTPELRAELDRVRDDPTFGQVEEAPPAPAPVMPAPAPGPVVDQVTVNGIVIRSSGQNASWINGTSIPAGDSTREGIRVQAEATGGGSVRLILPSGENTVQLKPGQKIDVLTGGVLEPYQRETDEDAPGLFEPLDSPLLDDPTRAQ